MDWTEQESWLEGQSGDYCRSPGEVRKGPHQGTGIRDREELVITLERQQSDSGEGWGMARKTSQDRWVFLDWWMVPTRTGTSVREAGIGKRIEFILFDILILKCL